MPPTPHLTKPEQLAKALPPPCGLLRIRWCRKKSRAKEDSQIHLSTNAEHLNADLLAPNSLLSPPSWRVVMPDALLALALLLALGAAVELCIKVAFVRLLPLLLRLP